MGVTVTPGAAFAAGPPRLVHEGRFFRTINGNTSFGITEDGGRFLRIQPVDPEAAITRVDLVLDWSAKLKRGAEGRADRGGPRWLVLAPLRDRRPRDLDRLGPGPTHTKGLPARSAPSRRSRVTLIPRVA